MLAALETGIITDTINSQPVIDGDLHPTAFSHYRLTLEMDG